MSQSRPHHLVAFASYYKQTHFKTLNAASALWRAEALFEDATAFSKFLDEAKQKDVIFGAGWGAEVFSYYAVGYVTCLEWHARSRLVDAMLFRPSIIETNDLTRIAKEALSQMMAEGVTVPHLMGAATHVSSIHEYLGVFKRVFNAIGLTEIVEAELRSAESEVILFGERSANNLYSVLAELFAFRNRLVHEIDVTVVGPYTLRDNWHSEYAAQYGKSVIDAIKLIEAKITQHSPQDFPNRLDSDGRGEDELEKLESAISSAETDLTEILELDEDKEFRASWARTLEASRASQNLELGFIEDASFLRPVRHLDFRRSFQSEYLKARLAYLLSLKAEAEQSYDLISGEGTTAAGTAQSIGSQER